MTAPNAAAAAAPPRSFAALRHPAYRAHFATYVLAMMADNIEHVISYWVMFQKFHSPALGGFAVVSHWLPFLLFSVPVGALNDRYDSRRLIQVGMLMFVVASLAWGWLFLTDSLQMWQAMAILVLHGCAGVLWQPSSQLLLHAVVPGQDLASAVRLNATARYLGILVGPAVGGALLLALGADRGMLVNTLFYLPLLVWLVKAPSAARAGRAARAVRGLADIVQTVRDIGGRPVLVSMVLLAGGASFFIGNGYQAQMPGFAEDLGHGDPGAAYSMLLAADAAGALLAGVVLESTGWLRADARTALTIAAAWCAALVCFALARSYPLALALLFAAGFLELSFGSMAQSLVQLEAPADIRGRVIGLFNMASLGMRTFSGITVGLAGTLVGIHRSLAASAVGLVVLTLWMSLRLRRRAAKPATP